ncbi:hypothetical protein [Fictibacillus gelatini]|uniref:hypothetical protein n=1 Tax=Fictibacillus gelatini TaxID=225985 RepID=UPI00047A3873|nr:hypothetical protein [Fictibacillus gelatini]
MFKIGEILSHHSDMMPNDSYPIGYYPDLGCIMVNSKRCKKGEKNYLWLFGIDRMDLKCDFKTWLDRMIMAQGNTIGKWFR